jgi:hypothetical protein
MIVTKVYSTKPRRSMVSFLPAMELKWLRTTSASGSCSSSFAARVIRVLTIRVNAVSEQRNDVEKGLNKGYSDRELIVDSAT